MSVSLCSAYFYAISSLILLFNFEVIILWVQLNVFNSLNYYL